MRNEQLTKCVVRFDVMYAAGFQNGQSDRPCYIEYIIYYYYWGPISNSSNCQISFYLLAWNVRNGAVPSIELAQCKQYWN